MRRNYLKWLTIVAPALFVGSVLFGRLLLAHSPFSWWDEIVTILIVVAGAVVFSTVVFRVIEYRELEIKSRSDQLAALHEAALTLTRELDLGIVLQKVVDLARELSGAKYGALGVLDENGEHFGQFITSGVSSSRRMRIGPPPKGHGLIGEVIHQGESLRVSEIERDNRFSGFPKHHPYMRTFIGVPIRFKEKVIGNLYLADKLDAKGEVTDFSEQDQQLLEMFATQAAIAIKNAQLYRQTQQLSILQERERFGMDLHDGIIQSIYAIGLMLEDTQHRLEEDLEAARQGLAKAIQGLNEVIRDIRNYILDLRPQRFQGRDLKEGLNELARDLRANSFLEVNLHLDGADSITLSPEKTVEILHIVQESLSNIRKHAHATRVDVSLSSSDGWMTLEISDDGVGLTEEKISNASGSGLRNMRERTQILGGRIRFVSPEEGGTRVVLSVPISDLQPAAHQTG